MVVSALGGTADWGCAVGECGEAGRGYPSKVERQEPSAERHSLTVLAPLPERTCRPSALKESPSPPSACSSSARRQRPLSTSQTLIGRSAVPDQTYASPLLSLTRWIVSSGPAN